MVVGRGWRALLGTLAVASMLASCTPDPTALRQLDDWRTLDLPTAMVPSTLHAQDGWLLIGGHLQHDPSRSPALARMPTDGIDSEPAPVPVTPTTPYGKVADLVSVTGFADEVVAVGAAQGGAHGNFRWTVWSGSVDRLVDRPQTFETFGGWQAGSLLGAATDSRGPLLVGTWQGTHGPDGAVWRVDDRRWTREPTPPALVSTASRQVTPRVVGQQTDGSVTVSGSVVDLTDGVHQSAAFWREAAGSWTQTVLPDPGRRSEAWSTACADVCWSVGARDDALAAWSGDHRVELPTQAVSDADSGRALIGGDRLVAVVSTASGGRLLVGQDELRVYTAPEGRVLAAELLGTRLFLVLGTEESARLVVRDLSDVLDR